MATWLDGMAAGAGAAWLKNKATTWMYDHEDPAARRAEDAARNGEFAYTLMARRAAQALDLEASEEQVARAGTAIHWGLGIGCVLVYAYVRRRWPRARAAHGLAFGLPFSWLLLDEAANPALGLSPPPQDFPWQTHARALAGHVVLWLAAETLLAALDGRRGND